MTPFGSQGGIRLALGAASSSSSAKVVQTEQLSVKLFDNKKMPAWTDTDFVGWAPGFENVRVWEYGMEYTRGVRIQGSSTSEGELLPMFPIPGDVAAGRRS